MRHSTGDNFAGAARYARCVDAGQVGVPFSEGGRWVGATRSALWPLARPGFSTALWARCFGTMINASGRAAATGIRGPFPERFAEVVDGMSKCVKYSGIELRVTYDPGFDPERGTVFCQNHISVLDGLLAASVIPQPFCGLMEAWHFNIPGYGWLMRLTHGIPVYPRAAGRTAEITEAARARVDEGVSILVFPEAHRTRDGHVRDYKRGVFFMARDAGIPVAPLVVRGLYEVNKRGRYNWDPGVVEVYCGPQIETQGLDDEGVTRLAEQMTAFANTWVEEGRADLGVFDG